MPIPNINSLIDHTSLYPDRVLISVTCGVTGMGSWLDFSSSMERGGWHRIPGKSSLRTSLDDGAFPLPVNATVSYNPLGRFLTFIVSLNALTDFHARRRDYDETGYPAGTTNWLHPQTNVTNIRARLCHHLNDRIMAAVLHLNALPLFQETSVILYLRSVRLHSLELCVDLMTPRGELFVARVAPRFLHRYNHVQRRFYSAAHGLLEVVSNQMLVRGFGAHEQNCKLY